VLLVDDDAECRAALKEMIRMDNYQVIEAGTCSEALKSLDPHIDIALIDYQLPDGNGIELLGTIRKTKPLLPVIIMTGYGTEDIAVRSFRTGATDYIKKPCSIYFLLRKMAEKLGGEIVMEESSPECAGNNDYAIIDGVAMHLEENHHIQDLSLDRLAEKFGMSKFRICRLFKEKFGRGYRSYLNETRLVHARELIRNSDLSISDIAYSAGFGSLSQFERVFREAEGLAPREYRKNMLLKKK